MTDAPDKRPSSSPPTEHPVPDVPLSPAGNLEIGAEQIGAGLGNDPLDTKPVFRKRYLALLFFAQFTLYIAFVAPIAY